MEFVKACNILTRNHINRKKETKGRKRSEAARHKTFSPKSDKELVSLIGRNLSSPKVDGTKFESGLNVYDMNSGIKALLWVYSDVDTFVVDIRVHARDTLDMIVRKILIARPRASWKGRGRKSTILSASVFSDQVLLFILSNLSSRSEPVSISVLKFVSKYGLYISYENRAAVANTLIGYMIKVLPTCSSALLEKFVSAHSLFTVYLGRSFLEESVRELCEVIFARAMEQAGDSKLETSLLVTFLKVGRLVKLAEKLANMIFESGEDMSHLKIAFALAAVEQDAVKFIFFPKPFFFRVSEILCTQLDNIVAHRSIIGLSLELTNATLLNTDYAFKLVTRTALHALIRGIRNMMVLSAENRYIGSAMILASSFDAQNSLFRGLAHVPYSGDGEIADSILNCHHLTRKMIENGEADSLVRGKAALLLGVTISTSIEMEKHVDEVESSLLSLLHLLDGTHSTTGPLRRSVCKALSTLIPQLTAMFTSESSITIEKSRLKSLLYGPIISRLLTVVANDAFWGSRFAAVEALGAINWGNTQCAVSMSRLYHQDAGHDDSSLIICTDEVDFSLREKLMSTLFLALSSGDDKIREVAAEVTLKVTQSIYFKSILHSAYALKPGEAGRQTTIPEVPTSVYIRWKEIAEVPVDLKKIASLLREEVTSDEDIVYSTESLQRVFTHLSTHILSQPLCYESSCDELLRTQKWSGMIALIHKIASLHLIPHIKSQATLTGSVHAKKLVAYSYGDFVPILVDGMSDFACSLGFFFQSDICTLITVVRSLAGYIYFAKGYKLMRHSVTAICERSLNLLRSIVASTTSISSSEDVNSMRDDGFVGTEEIIREIVGLGDVEGTYRELIESSLLLIRSVVHSFFGNVLPILDKILELLKELLELSPAFTHATGDIAGIIAEIYDQVMPASTNTSGSSDDANKNLLEKLKPINSAVIDNLLFTSDDETVTAIVNLLIRMLLHGASFAKLDYDNSIRSYIKDRCILLGDSKDSAFLATGLRLLFYVALNSDAEDLDVEAGQISPESQLDSRTKVEKLLGEISLVIRKGIEEASESEKGERRMEYLNGMSELMPEFARIASGTVAAMAREQIFDDLMRDALSLFDMCAGRFPSRHSLVFLNENAPLMESALRYVRVYAESFGFGNYAKDATHRLSILLMGVAGANSGYDGGRKLNDPNRLPWARPGKRYTSLLKEALLLVEKMKEMGVSFQSLADIVKDTLTSFKEGMVVAEGSLSTSDGDLDSERVATSSLGFVLSFAINLLSISERGTFSGTVVDVCPVIRRMEDDAVKELLLSLILCHRYFTSNVLSETACELLPLLKGAHSSSDAVHMICSSIASMIPGIVSDGDILSKIPGIRRRILSLVNSWRGYMPLSVLKCSVLFILVEHQMDLKNSSSGAETTATAIGEELVEAADVKPHKGHVSASIGRVMDLCDRIDAMQEIIQGHSESERIAVLDSSLDVYNECLAVLSCSQTSVQVPFWVWRVIAEYVLGYATAMIPPIFFSKCEDADWNSSTARMYQEWFDISGYRDIQPNGGSISAGTPACALHFDSLAAVAQTDYLLRHIPQILRPQSIHYTKLLSDILLAHLSADPMRIICRQENVEVSLLDAREAEFGDINDLASYSVKNGSQLHFREDTRQCVRNILVFLGFLKMRTYSERSFSRAFSDARYSREELQAVPARLWDLFLTYSFTKDAKERVVLQDLKIMGLVKTLILDLESKEGRVSEKEVNLSAKIMQSQFSKVLDAPISTPSTTRTILMFIVSLHHIFSGNLLNVLHSQITRRIGTTATGDSAAELTELYEYIGIPAYVALAGVSSPERRGYSYLVADLSNYQTIRQLKRGNRTFRVFIDHYGYQGNHESIEAQVQPLAAYINRVVLSRNWIYSEESGTGPIQHIFGLYIVLNALKIMAMISVRIDVKNVLFNIDRYRGGSATLEMMKSTRLISLILRNLRRYTRNAMTLILRRFNDLHIQQNSLTYHILLFEIISMLMSTQQATEGYVRFVASFLDDFFQIIGELGDGKDRTNASATRMIAGRIIKMLVSVMMASRGMGATILEPCLDKIIARFLTPNLVYIKDLNIVLIYSMISSDIKTDISMFLKKTGRIEAIEDDSVEKDDEEVKEVKEVAFSSPQRGLELLKYFQILRDSYAGEITQQISENLARIFTSYGDKTVLVNMALENIVTIPVDLHLSRDQAKVSGRVKLSLSILRIVLGDEAGAETQEPEEGGKEDLLTTFARQRVLQELCWTLLENSIACEQNGHILFLALFAALLVSSSGSRGLRKFDALVSDSLLQIGAEEAGGIWEAYSSTATEAEKSALRVAVEEHQSEISSLGPFLMDIFERLVA